MSDQPKKSVVGSRFSSHFLLGPNWVQGINWLKLTLRLLFLGFLLDSIVGMRLGQHTGIGKGRSTEVVGGTGILE